MTQLFHRMIRHDEGQDPEGVMESKPHAEGTLRARSDRSVTYLKIRLAPVVLLRLEKAVARETQLFHRKERLVSGWNEKPDKL